MATTTMPGLRTVGNPVGDSTADSTSGILDSLSYQDRKEQQICVYPGCNKAPEERSLRCPKHAEAKRKADREYIAREREVRANEGLCIVCGRVRREGSDWGCAVCHPVGNAVGKAERIAAATTARATASNLGRTHWHGQNKRGPMSPEALNRQAIEAATKELSSALTENSYAHSAEVKALPKIQRMSEQARLTGRLYFVIRLVASAPAMKGVDLSDLVESLEDEED